LKETLENTKGAIKKAQFRGTGNTGYARRRKTNKNTTQYVLNTTIRKQTQITLIRYEPSYKQLEVNTNRTSSLCGNRNGHHNRERKDT
jgi:hypothetical protein